MTSASNLHVLDPLTHRPLIHHLFHYRICTEMIFLCILFQQKLDMKVLTPLHYPKYTEEGLPRPIALSSAHFCMTDLTCCVWAGCIFLHWGPKG